MALVINILAIDTQQGGCKDKSSISTDFDSDNVLFIANTKRSFTKARKTKKHFILISCEICHNLVTGSYQWDVELVNTKIT